MAPQKHQFRRRPRRVGTTQPPEIVQIKSPSSSETKRQHSKKRHFRRKTQHATLPQTPVPIRPKPPKLLVDRNVRSRWTQIAKETQMIVLGDGQYVEERCVSVAPCSLAQRIEGISTDPLGHADQPPTVTVTHNISQQIRSSCQGTYFYPHHTETLADWATPRPGAASPPHKTALDFVRRSTLAAAHHFAQKAPPGSPGIGVLSSASRKRPGGGYLHGGDDQEERIARLSSLVASLSCPVAKDFYSEHQHFWTQDGSGFHDRSMVYSPGVVVFRADHDDPDAFPKDPRGGSFISPYQVDVLSVVPVNAAVVRARYTSASERTSDEAVRNSMKERMGRALRVFEERGNKVLVLGAFGCSSSENKLDIVAGIWAELLLCGDMEGAGGGRRPARFKDSFDTVIFAIPGKSFKVFRDAFEMRLFEADLVDTLTTE